MFDLIVKNATIVLSSGRFEADLAVRDGKVAAIGGDLGAAAEEVDARGLHLLPGLIDIHVHFRDPGLTYKEDFSTGSLAAACGGVTTVHDMPNTVPPVATAELFRAKLEAVREKSFVDFGLYGIVLPDNEEQLEGLAEAGAMGYKLYMGETTGHNPCPDDGVILGAFRKAAKLGLIVGCHAENNPIMQRLKEELMAAGRTDPRAHLDSRPTMIEAEAVGRATTIAGAAGNHVHIHHLSTGEGLERVREARRRGVRVTCEALVGHLVLDDSAYERLGNVVRLNPPIREREHLEALWEGIARGEIDCVATDHAPHSVEEKTRENVWESVSGLLGVETMLPLMLTQAAQGRLSVERVVQLTSENPARIYGHYPRKGSLQIGADADFVLVDLAKRYRLANERLHSRSKIMPYDGWEVVGQPEATYLRGGCVVREGEAVGQPRGRHLRPGCGRRP